MALWPRRDQAPLIWREFCEGWLKLSRTKSEDWWHALCAATWSRPVAVRSAMVYRTALHDGGPPLPALDNQTLSPAQLIGSLEDLIQEGRLGPLKARRIEEAVLQRTDVHGQWKGA